MRRVRSKKLNNGQKTVYRNRRNAVITHGFRGLCHREYAGQDDIYSMKDLGDSHYPLVSPRPKRYTVLASHLGSAVRGIGGDSHGKLFWVESGFFYYDGVIRGMGLDNRTKYMAVIGEKIVIFPDKKYYDTVTGVFGSLVKSVELRNAHVSFWEEVPHFSENIMKTGSDDLSLTFKVGDRVRIVAYIDTQVEMDQVHVIRKLGFVGGEYTATFDRDSFLTIIGKDLTRVVISNKVPDLDTVVACQDRLYGSSNGKIYASRKLDPSSWFFGESCLERDYNTKMLDSGDSIPFTDCAEYGGHPYFFKPDGVYKVLGNEPYTMSLSKVYSGFGIREEFKGTAAHAGDSLFWMTSTGIVRYRGGAPEHISEPLGERFSKGCGGGNDAYYVFNGQCSDGEFRTYVYSLRHDSWFSESGGEKKFYTECLGNIFAVGANNSITTVGPVHDPKSTWTLDTAVDSNFETGGVSDSSLEQRRLDSISLSCVIPEGSRIIMYVKLDNGTWKEIFTKIGGGDQVITREVSLPYADDIRFRFVCRNDYIIKNFTHRYTFKDEKSGFFGTEKGI